MELEKPDAALLPPPPGTTLVVPPTVGPDLQTANPSSFSMDYTQFEIGFDANQATVQNGNNYDPNRIPASIFSDTSTAVANWSIASNESLFSVDSFSRNSSSSVHSIIPKEPDWMDSQHHFSLDIGSFKQLDLSTITVPPIVEGPPTKESSVIATRTETLHPPTTIITTPDYRVTSSGGAPRLSNVSMTSTSSFAFPVLVKDSGSVGRTEVETGVNEKPQPPLQEKPLPKEIIPKPKAAPKKYRLCCFPRWSWSWSWNKRWCCC